MRYNILTQIFVGYLLIIATSCNSGERSIDKDRMHTEVVQAMDGMVMAWNDQKLEEALSYYWNSPDLVWINRTGVDKGYQPIFYAYLQDFQDRSKMGTYTYKLLHEEVLGSNAVFTTIEWKITMAEDTIGGVSSFIWKKIDGRWVITKEHAS